MPDSFAFLTLRAVPDSTRTRTRMPTSSLSLNTRYIHRTDVIEGQGRFQEEHQGTKSFYQPHCLNPTLPDHAGVLRSTSAPHPPIRTTRSPRPTDCHPPNRSCSDCDGLCTTICDPTPLMQTGALTEGAGFACVFDSAPHHPILPLLASNLLAFVQIGTRSLLGYREESRGLTG
ncbi:hypothetical protein JAAARDRAFT_492831 [Jaapia argillacea MUCL 33604]|uniref:Uncharacterized protein n=1 Tax=Jaapia argillacea MUCL 33604 TaxID=933084 RepID=A0A067PDU5_9AGAM|nr:hypothetical protein JAAARDRAFT_492831 [Jaapia argillacea MUCL 33604]